MAKYQMIEQQADKTPDDGVTICLRRELTHRLRHAITKVSSVMMVGVPSTGLHVMIYSG